MNNQRVVILKVKEGERYLPIWIGPAEADAIAVKIQGVYLPRPLTHDLLCNIAGVAGLRIKAAIINKLDNDTYYAKLVLASRAKSHEVDCRPSDALAVAVRTGVPIFADEKVLGKAGIYLDEEGKPTELPPEKNTAIKDKTERKLSQLEMFSESSQGVLNSAAEEARRLNHNFVSTGHLLLALVKEINPASEILKNLGANLVDIPTQVEALIDKRSSTEEDEIGLTSAVKKTIELSIEEAKLLGSGKVQPEHILIGLVRQNDDIAAGFLKSLRINPERIYIELIRFYTQPGHKQQSQSDLQ